MQAIKVLSKITSVINSTFPRKSFLLTRSQSHTSTLRRLSASVSSSSNSKLSFQRGQQDFFTTQMNMFESPASRGQFEQRYALVINNEWKLQLMCIHCLPQLNCPFKRLAKKKQFHSPSQCDSKLITIKFPQTQILSLGFLEESAMVNHCRMLKHIKRASGWSIM